MNVSSMSMSSSNSHHERHSPALHPTLSPVLYIRETGMAPLPDVAQMPLAPPRNGCGGAMAACRGAPLFPNREVDAEKWPPGFAYDINVALPPLPPQHLLCSYADIASNRRSALPSGSTLGAGFVSSEEGAFPRL